MNPLNAEQQRIVEHLDGPALVIAGAGSGKTRVIVHRVARLIERGVPAGAILMVTFTNKSAEEMQRRVEALLGKGKADELVCGTFHSVANRFLRRYAPLVGFQHNFSILDDSDSRDMIKAAAAECVGKDADRTVRKFPNANVIQTVLSMAFNRNLPLGKLLEREYPWLEQFRGDLEAIQEAYRRKKQVNNAMDFDDLLDHWNTLLAGHPEIELARRLRHLLVDEYQDTNVIQAEILERLAGAGGNLMVVGDDAQSIYGWRGANFQNILKFQERFGGVIYRLEENYRSTPDILALANASINHNAAQFTKNLRAVRPALEKPRVTHVYDEYAEADLTVERILHHADRDLPLASMGVLYRNHMQSAVLQMRLAERGIAFTVRSGIKFFEQAHIKDAVSFLKVVFNPMDEIAWLRVLKLLPGVGNATAQRVFRLFQEQRAVRLSPENLDLNRLIPPKARESWRDLAACFKELLADGMGPAQMIETVRRGFYQDVLRSQFDNAPERDADLGYMAEFAARYRSLERFLAQLALVGSTVIHDAETEEREDEDLLTLTTIHQAKGLEWDVVFLIGLADGKLPHARNLEPPERLEEERRLFYVAITRCKRYLELTVPLMVNSMSGGNEVCRPSRFVEELPSDAVELIKAADAENMRPAAGGRVRLTVEW